MSMFVFEQIRDFVINCFSHQQAVKMNDVHVVSINLTKTFDRDYICGETESILEIILENGKVYSFNNLKNIIFKMHTNVHKDCQSINVQFKPLDQQDSTDSSEYESHVFTTCFHNYR